MSQKYFREEHMIIMNRVKSKLENEYDILIVEAHFSYILNYDEEDKNTVEFCKNNNLNYLSFSINDLCFKNIENPILNNKTFITKNFPIHSSFSILPEEKFDINNGILLQKDFIKKFQDKLIYEDIDDDLKILLDENIILINELAKNDANIFKIFGHFKKLFDVNNNYCMWFDNTTLSFYNYSEGNGYLKSNLEYSKKLSDENFTLICSKYKIKKKKKKEDKK